MFNISANVIGFDAQRSFIASCYHFLLAKASIVQYCFKVSEFIKRHVVIVYCIDK
jgi:hypothetical protein